MPGSRAGAKSTSAGMGEGVEVTIGGEEDRDLVDAEVGELVGRAVAIFEVAATDDADDQRRFGAIEGAGYVDGEGAIPGLLGADEAVGGGWIGGAAGGAGEAAEILAVGREGGPGRGEAVTLPPRAGG